MEFENYYPKPYESHLYDKYCRCSGKPVCICLVTRVTDYNKKIQKILINGLEVDTIKLVDKPQLIPPKEVKPYVPTKPKEVYIPNSKRRKAGRPRGSRNKNKEKRPKRCIIEKDKIIPVFDLIPEEKSDSATAELLSKGKSEVPIVPNVPEQKKEEQAPPKKEQELTSYQKRLKSNREYAIRNKNKFKCNICNYNTHNISIIKRHNKSKLHKDKMEKMSVEVADVLNNILNNINYNRTHDVELMIPRESSTNELVEIKQNEGITFEKIGNELNETLYFIKNLFKN